MTMGSVRAAVPVPGNVSAGPIAIQDEGEGKESPMLIEFKELTQFPKDKWFEGSLFIEASEIVAIGPFPGVEAETRIVLRGGCQFRILEPIAEVREKWEKALERPGPFNLKQWPRDPLLAKHFPQQKPEPLYWTVQCTRDGCGAMMHWRPSKSRYECDACGNHPAAIHIGDFCSGCGQDITGRIGKHACSPGQQTPPPAVAGQIAEAAK